MSQSGSLSSPSKDSISMGTNSLTGTENLPRDFSRLSLFSSTSSTSQEEQFRCEGHAEHSLSCMKHYLQTEKLCDVVLIAGNNGKRVPAHRLVLCAASEYFSAMFTGSLRESEEFEITLGDVNGEVLQAVVNYCYTGTIEIREDNVEILLATACLMQLRNVVEACSRFLAQQLHPSNCLGIAVFAEHQACTSLLQEANAYTSQHFMEVIRNQEFLQLSVEQMAILLSSDELNVSSEEHIFHALMSWIQHESQSRKPHMARLLSLVKLPLLEPSFLVDQVENLINHDPECQKLIMEAMKWHLLPERRTQMSGARTRPRKATMGKLIVVGGMDKNKGATTIECYDPRIDSWTVAYHMSGRRLQFGIALMGEKLLVVGGRDGLKTLNTMECLDLETGTWTLLSPMNTHRHGLGVAILGGPLYAVGGHDGWSYLNTVERYDPITRSWNYVAPMTSQRCSAGVAVLNGKLYAVGGRDGASCLKSVECYDPHTNKWTMCAWMSRRRGGVGVAVANGYLYAFGGQDAPANNPAASRFDCVERYDPSTDSWSTVTSLTSKRDTIAACLFGDRLIAAGGYDGSRYLQSVEQYDPITNEWTTLASLLTGRAGACIIPISNNTNQIN
ncbi:BTB And C-terminal Kelch domain containing protein [Oryctes borbonicus]|uniref:Kelch-like protein diablo n=1 Tax=Oryctes borbonicus TaxID=1629725 RepID=A0A0T6AVB5_9SCAR|nr:BTB And C-terminal Kelch domain containing protein [Oryctes borbonicus]